MLVKKTVLYPFHPLKIYLTFFKKHFKEDFHPFYYGATILVLFVSIWVNYHFNFKKTIIDSYGESEIRILWYFLFYGLPYYCATFLYVSIFRKPEILKTKKFWILSVFGLIVLSVSSGFHYHRTFAYSDYVPSELSYYLRRCLFFLRGIITVLLPMALLHRFYIRKGTFYGLAVKKTNLRPYLIMLALMVPLIAWASFQPDFLRQYPSLRASQINEYLNLPEWLTVLVYQICYGWDFVATELLFRGFFVIAMASALGRGAILPMVVIYAFLHFGKPLGETLGAIFGGYILGVIALNTRSIWGGIVIHLGVAWLMDLFAYLQSFR